MENQTDYNVDIVDHATGEIYAESLQHAAAQERISDKGWELVSETTEELTGDNLDGGGERPFILRTLWVNTGIDLASEEEMRRRAAAWWGYES